MPCCHGAPLTLAFNSLPPSRFPWKENQLALAWTVHLPQLPVVLVAQSNRMPVVVCACHGEVWVKLEMLQAAAGVMCWSWKGTWLQRGITHAVLPWRGCVNGIKYPWPAGRTGYKRLGQEDVKWKIAALLHPASSFLSLATFFPLPFTIRIKQDEQGCRCALNKEAQLHNLFLLVWWGGISQTHLEGGQGGTRTLLFSLLPLQVADFKWQIYD